MSFQKTVYILGQTIESLFAVLLLIAKIKCKSMFGRITSLLTRYNYYYTCTVHMFYLETTFRILRRNTCTYI